MLIDDLKNLKNLKDLSSASQIRKIVDSIIQEYGLKLDKQQKIIIEKFKELLIKKLITNNYNENERMHSSHSSNYFTNNVSIMISENIWTILKIEFQLNELDEDGSIRSTNEISHSLNDLNEFVINLKYLTKISDFRNGKVKILDKEECSKFLNKLEYN